MKNNIFHQRTPKKHIVFHFFAKKRKLYFFFLRRQGHRGVQNKIQHFTVRYCDVSHV